MRRFTPRAPSRANNNSQFSIAADKSRKPAENKVLADTKFDALSSLLAVPVRRFQVTSPALTVSGSRIRSEPLGTGDAIVVTGSGN
jgi:hypothetical protein